MRLIHLSTAPAFLPVDHFRTFPVELVAFHIGMARRRRQINPPMLRLRQMFDHPHACGSARFTNVRCFANSATDGINHSRVFLWVATILEAILKRPLPLARSSYDADAERTKNVLDSLRSFVDERYHDGCGIRVVSFAKN